MMDVPINGPTYVYGDNMSVINNTSKPHSTLHKKSNSICYHFVREAVAMKECVTTHIPILQNLADLLTKVLSGIKKENLCRESCGISMTTFSHRQVPILMSRDSILFCFFVSWTAL